MWTMAVLVGLFLFFSCIILPWINRTNIADLRDKVEHLQSEIRRLNGSTNASPSPSPADISHKVRTSTPQPHADYNDNPFYEPSITPKVDHQEQAKEAHATRAESTLKDPQKEDTTASWTVLGPSTVPQERTAQKNQPSNFEQTFGGHAFVWLGGIALAFAGFYLIKYSIESGLLTENIRVMLGIVFGGGLLYGSHIIRQHPALADSERISQALAGAALADLYGSVYAAASLYHLVPSWLGLGGMALVTACALVLSLRYGPPIAVLGLIGGFATPLIFHGEPNTPLLFGYLYLVVGGLMVVVRQRAWWGLSIPAVLIALIWCFFWISNGISGDDGVWLSLFVLGLSATVVAATHNTEDNGQPTTQPSLLRYIAIGGSLALMSDITYTAHFGIFEWGVFALFSLSTIVLSWFDNRTYSFCPWLAMGANVLMLLGWSPTDNGELAAILIGFGALFSVSSYCLMSRSRNPVSWALLSAISAFVYYLLAYHKLDSVLVTNWLEKNGFTSKEFWSFLAIVMACLYIAATNRLFETYKALPQRQALQAVFSVVATSFLSLGLAVLLQLEFLEFALVVQILSLCTMNRYVDIPALREIAKALTALFVLLLVPQILPILSLSLFSDFTRYSSVEWGHVDTLKSMIFQLALPSLMLAGSSWLLRQQRDDVFVAVLEVLSIALFVVLIFNSIKSAFLGQEQEFCSRSLFTNCLLVLGLLGLYGGRSFKRPAIVVSALVLSGLAFIQIAYVDVLFDNPLWTHERVGGMPVINALALAYALPTVLMVALRQELLLIHRHKWGSLTGVGAYLLGFIFVSLSVRQFYHGTYLDRGMVSNAEVYCYSAVWLVMGMGLLFAGVVRRDSMMRTASLLTMLLTVGKVFLYDASEMTGLWRVLSFFGLGLSLLGLSWFYSRYVFGTRKVSSNNEHD